MDNEYSEAFIEEATRALMDLGLTEDEAEREVEEYYYG